MLAAKLPFILHMLVETAAAQSFIFRPASQLPPLVAGSEPVFQEASLVFKSLGGALLATNLVALVFALRDGFDDTSRLVALSLATYHFWPGYRAAVRISRRRRRRAEGGGDKDAPFGGPAVHLVAHILCLSGLLYSGLLGGSSGA